MKWFDQSNQNPTATFDNNIMEGTCISGHVSKHD